MTKEAYGIPDVDSGRVPSGNRLSSSTMPASGHGPTGFDPARVEAVVQEITEIFGPGHSNGIVGIMVHDKLPERFGREEWADWTIRPAQAAFERARDLGLISPSPPEKWTFTPLGLAVAQRYQSEADE